MAKKDKTDPPEHWHSIFFKEFSKESDRAAVILSSAIIDNLLTSLLKTYFCPNSGSKDELLDGTAPLSDFSSKINIANRIGLISNKLARDLHLIRHIRNDFAHNITGCNFNDNRVSSKIFELNKSSGFVEKNPEIRKKFPPGIRGDFQMNVSWMIWHLGDFTKNVSPLKNSKEEWGYSSEGISFSKT